MGMDALPNVHLILTDQQRFDTIGVCGSPHNANVPTCPWSGIEPLED